MKYLQLTVLFLDFASNFDVKIIISKSLVDLELRTPLQESVLKTEQFLNLTLQAFSQGLERLNDAIRIFIALPTKGIKFYFLVSQVLSARQFAVKICIYYLKPIN